MSNLAFFLPAERLQNKQINYTDSSFFLNLLYMLYIPSFFIFLEIASISSFLETFIPRMLLTLLLIFFLKNVLATLYINGDFYLTHPKKAILLSLRIVSLPCPLCPADKGFFHFPSLPCR